MKCRYCGSMESKVVDSRPNEDSTAIRRRRECIQCGRRFTTFERIEENPIMVVKRDGRRESESRSSPKHPTFLPWCRHCPEGFPIPHGL